MKPFSWIFADIPVSGSSFFRLVETEFSSNPSPRLVYMDSGSISNRVRLFRASFLLLENFTEIRCKLVFLGILSSQEWKRFFRLVETNFLSKAIHSDGWKRIFSSVPLFKTNFVLAETIIQVYGEAIFYGRTSFLLLETIFYALLVYIFLPVKAVFRRSENVFF